MKNIIFFLLLLSSGILKAQQQPIPSDVEELKKEIILLKSDVENIQINLAKGERKFKQGILVATIGYSVTIAGGLMLGRKNDELGKVLLVAGGAAGITGTAMMFNAFRYLGKAGKQKHQR
jgi:hypothetical protein